MLKHVRVRVHTIRLSTAAPGTHNRRSLLTPHVSTRLAWICRSKTRVSSHTTWRYCWLHPVRTRYRTDGSAQYIYSLLVRRPSEYIQSQTSHKQSHAMRHAHVLINSYQDNTKVPLTGYTNGRYKQELNHYNCLINITILWH